MAPQIGSPPSSAATKSKSMERRQGLINAPSRSSQRNLKIPVLSFRTTTLVPSNLVVPTGGQHRVAPARTPARSAPTRCTCLVLLLCVYLLPPSPDWAPACLSFHVRSDRRSVYGCTVSGETSRFLPLLTVPRLAHTSGARHEEYYPTYRRPW